jgi:solute carrier family 35 protein C2
MTSNDTEYSLDESLEGRALHFGDAGMHPTDIEPVQLATLAQKKRLWWRNAIVNAIFIASWCAWKAILSFADRLIGSHRFFFSTILSVYNKWMFSEGEGFFGFPYPLFVTAMHFFVQFALAALLRAIWPQRFRPAHSPTAADYG